MIRSTCCLSFVLSTFEYTFERDRLLRFDSKPVLLYFLVQMYKKTFIVFLQYIKE